VSWAAMTWEFLFTSVTIKAYAATSIVGKALRSQNSPWWAIEIHKFFVVLWDCQ
jgi:hypothetical protein